MRQNLESFVRDCRRQAEAGEPKSQYDLGILYSTGKGVPMDYIRAHQWFNLAAMGGMPEARGLRGELADVTPPEDVAEALRLARSWLGEHVPGPRRVSVAA